MSVDVDFGGTDRYQIMRRVGEGGMGVVYQALDRERKTTVALKTLRHVDASSIFRFKREFRALADVSHPNLVSLHELQCVDGQWFFTMELSRAINFLAYVRDGYEVMRSDTLDLAGAAPPPTAPSGQLDPRRLRAALGQLVEGVAALHEAGQAAPRHQAVERAGHARGARRAPRLRAGHRRGARARAAEHRRARRHVGVHGAGAGGAAPLTAASDWYAVGVMLYEALTGQLPFEGSSLEMLDEQAAARAAAAARCSPPRRPPISTRSASSSCARARGRGRRAPRSCGASAPTLSGAG